MPLRWFIVFVLISQLVFGQQAIPPKGGTATAPNTLNILSGDGLGGLIDSGIAPGSVQTGSTAPAYTANQPTAGCGVEYTTGLTLTVGACTYTINGVQYASVQTNLTLSTADTMNDRQDAVIVDNTGTASVLTGTPAVNPVVPTVDPSTQLMLTSAYVAANATTPTNAVVTNNIFDEGTEWGQTYSAHLALSTNNPYLNTHDVEATNAVLNNSVKLIKPASGTIDLAASNNLIFYIRSKAKWPTGASGSTALRTLSIYWESGSTIKGNTIVLRDGQFGFSSSNITGYQQISIPTSLFGINGITVTALLFQVSGNSGSSSIGFYIDDVTLQGGLQAPPLPATLMNFRTVYSSTAAYNVNDVVVSSNGRAYLALIANTGVALSNATTWQPFGKSARPMGATFTGGGAVVGQTVYFTAVQACTVSAWNIAAAPSGTASIDIWKVATGTAIPTVSNTILSGGYLSLATGTAIHSTTLTRFTTTAIAANDIIAINLQAIATATYVNFVLECDIL